ncbi:serine--tRNA ligase [Enterovirga aerilata]|uniref:Serine--tRNA ligase n=1 Tax=Enterovirga aerilata TaxID=2730920 RepID=A0A849I6S4_9HYPH|nr:serine--tRNA ligase [Enterovirga sp. DB1703]NNM72109.1 serine--tRNA ligase [Enterovirga sp. DB1703]
MHDIRLIRENPAAFDQALVNRGLEPLSAELIRLDDARRAAIAQAQAAQEKRNALSKEIGAAKKAKDEARAAELMTEVARLKDAIPEAERREKEATAALETCLAEIPNIPLPEVPVGPDETANVQREEHRFEGARQVGSGRQHFELGEAWRGPGGPLMDFETAAKLSGSRFVVLRGQLARLERALGQFMLDLHTTEHGYTEVSPPLMVRDEAMFGTAQLPKFKEDQFTATRIITNEELPDVLGEALRVPGSDFRTVDAGEGQTSWQVKPPEGGWFNIQEGFIEALLAKIGLHWLIPTAEVPLTNLVRESILSEEELPLRFTALTPCFRAEAGAAGRDTRGMLRQHQFTKCELVSITTPETSAEEHERMLACAERVLQLLDLPFRVMTLCTGDMGFASQKTYDIEVWMPGQGTYREISSCSVCGDFQARRMNARYRPKPEAGGKPGAPRFVHTLNGSGVAVGRALIAVLENYQEPDGSVTVPSALVPYMGGLTRIGGEG